MGLSVKASVKSVNLYYLPVKTRMPLKFGNDITTSVICARAKVEISVQGSNTCIGWGETPLSVQWVWPSTLSFEKRLATLKELTEKIALSWKHNTVTGHPLQIGYDFLTKELKNLLSEINLSRSSNDQIPWLAALVCASAFDIATHDAFGKLINKPVYDTYGKEYLDQDLSVFFHDSQFSGKYPADYLHKKSNQLVAWHLVGGLDPVSREELTGTEPDDNYPILLEDWIKKDGLKALKIKLTGNNYDWDYQRIIKIGSIAKRYKVLWLSVDFNCTVQEPEYVNNILDCLRDNEPETYASILYVEQPFPYDLEQHQIDVRSVVARKPLFMDESAHDWKIIKLGRSLGWSGVALKTCKTQTGAILSLCWARQNGMTLMVQDLTNPMLAQIPHVLLASHAGTIMGVETNSMQFYPEASFPEQEIHPGLYQRKHGKIDLSSINGSGFGYNIDLIQRDLPEPVI